MPGGHYTNHQSSRRANEALVSRSAPGVFAPSRLCVSNRSGKNAYIIRTKCAQKREWEISTSVTSTTYNFNALKCTDFPIAPCSPSSLGHSSFFRISSLVTRHWSLGPEIAATKAARAGLICRDLRALDVSQPERHF